MARQRLRVVAMVAAPVVATTGSPAAAARSALPTSFRWSSSGPLISYTSYGDWSQAVAPQTLEIDPCRLRYLYQGMNPSASGDYSQLPWRLGLTQTKSNC